MRLLWLGHFLPFPPQGGNLQRSHHLLKEAAGRHEVHLVALSQRAILSTAEARAEAITALRPLVASLTVFDIPSDASRVRWYMLAATSFFRSTPYAASW